MKTYPSAQTLGFFDVELRVQWLEAKGNPLSRLDAVIDWEWKQSCFFQKLFMIRANWIGPIRAVVAQSVLRRQQLLANDRFPAEVRRGFQHRLEFSAALVGHFGGIQFLCEPEKAAL